MDLLQGFSALAAYENLKDEALCLATSNNRIVFVNLAFCKIFGYEDYHGVVGKQLKDLIAQGVMHPHNANMADMLPENLENFRHPLEGVVPGKSADGETFDVWIGNRLFFWLGESLFMSCNARLPDPTD